MGTLGITKKVKESIAYIEQFTSASPQIAIVLGTGMHSITEAIQNPVEINFSDIPHFPISTVQSHKSKLIFGEINGRNVVCVGGRFHYYEGYKMEEVTYYIHVLKALGIKTSILTSASGGINPHFKEGQIVLINDHINLFPDNPLRGANDEGLGPRFPDLMKAYPIHLQEAALKGAQHLGIDLKAGVYLGLQGPSLETPAEYRMANILGADLVGMSTVPEVIVNKYRGISTLAFTIVSNVCFPRSALNETTVDEVINVVNKNAKTLQRLIIDILPSL